MRTRRSTLLDADWMRRLAAVEQRDVEGRLRVLLRADPLAARIDRVGGASCATARSAESHLYNRAFQVTVPDLERVAAHHRALARPCYVDVHPYMADHHLGRALQQCGFALSNMNAIHVGEATGQESLDRRIEPVITREDWDAFESAEADGWGQTQPAPGRSFWGQAGYRAFVARVDDQPAAAAVLFVADDVGYLASAATAPDFRGRGLHTALIRHRVHEAHRLGARIVFSHTFFDEPSSHNLARCGLPLAYTSPLFADLSYWT